MIRHLTRALCATTLVIAPIALTATPAHAVTTCRVNGVTVSSANVVGTAGPDYITCGPLAPGDQVSGLGGADYITIGGSLGGGAVVRGGTGGDYILVNGSVGPMAQVLGEADGDYIRVGTNLGAVNGGTGFDLCRVAGGNPPVNCEA
ncbi:hypothetical protein [Streptomyces globisporus]|uniref:hypothetical protein n=1 Tax=Streptomyces globisporus TaxID=1908 RepID=UPI0004C9B9C2|nr:hypothetical protein [Streptomyces globisporus]